MKSNGVKKAGIIILLIVALACVTMLSGCRQSSRVNYNISQQADNFKILRRITVINVRDNNMLYELEGFFSLSNSTANELIVTSQIGVDEYKKDYIYLNEYTTYVVEQLKAEGVNPYHYAFTIFPRMYGWVDIEIKSE